MIRMNIAGREAVQESDDTSGGRSSFSLGVSMTARASSSSTSSSRSSNVSIGPMRRYVNKMDMGTISEDTIALPANAENETPYVGQLWSNDRFKLHPDGRVRHQKTNEPISDDDIKQYGEELLQPLIEHVHSLMLDELRFEEQAIPAFDFSQTKSDFSNSTVSSHSSVRSSSSSIRSTVDGFRTMIDSDVPRCIFHTSQRYDLARQLLVFVCSSRGLSTGIWSRNLLLSEGVTVGSMLPYFRNAVRRGYGIVVANPNMNSQVLFDPEDCQSKKLPIEGSSTKEEHCEHIWRKYIAPSSAHKIHFIAFGYGGALVSEMIDKYRHELRSRLGSVAFIESAHKADASWSSTFQTFFRQHSVCWMRAPEPLGTDLSAAADKKEDKSESSSASSGSSKDVDSRHVTAALRGPSSSSVSSFGCLCLSAGPGPSADSSPAYTTRDVLDAVFDFLDSPSAYEYQRTAERSLQLQKRIDEQHKKLVLGQQLRGRGVSSPSNSRVKTPNLFARPQKDSSAPASSPSNGSSRVRAWSRGISNRINLTPKDPTTTTVVGAEQLRDPPAAASPREDKPVGIDDFELMRVIGKGAFGKVMLVRRRGVVFAMKVVKKAAVFKRNQVEHTKTERRILQEIDHPFLVKLRYAFQTPQKLYFVMDYYNGGTLHFHLRRALQFDDNRARFYAAQLVLALAHLHSYGIVYRDLKPDNVLMDAQGYLAVTDFGLSHDKVGVGRDGLKLSTFCGTPEYIAPELIRKEKYGRFADFWSLGILIYEMLAGYTPFYNANRKKNFDNIARMPLRLPGYFSEEAKSLLRGLICKDPSKRLGSGPSGAEEIKEHPFFNGIDWEKLFRREVPPPFRPMTGVGDETNNVPEFFKRQQVEDSIVSESVPTGKSQVFMDFSYVDPFEM